MKIEILDKKHKRDEFDCGNEQLNNYLIHQAGQDMKRKLSVCFVITESSSNRILGYYTLSNNSISLDYFSEEIQKKLPRTYKSIPTTLLGRLAIDKKQQGKGIGEKILIDALKRSHNLSKEIGSFAVIVDPIDIDAERFYIKYDFIKLPDSGKMFIAIKTLHQLFS